MRRESSTVTVQGPDKEEGIIYSNLNKYKVLRVMGEGSFGCVMHCINMATQEAVAIKIIKDNSKNFSDNEVSILEMVNWVNPDLYSLVRFHEHFMFGGYACLAFEMLDRDLFNFICQRGAMTLDEIRPIAEQLLAALGALHCLGIVHADIKPDNIMFVNLAEQPDTVKLIDFGLAFTSTKIQQGMRVQPLSYRAPEVSLGLPFTGSIDMWGLGCVLAFMYLGNHLFPVGCKYHMMRCLVDLLGQPEDHHLQTGMYAKYYFKQESVGGDPQWSFMTPEEFTEFSGLPVSQNDPTLLMPTCLEQLQSPYPVTDAAQLADRTLFLNLLKQMLHVDGAERISPLEALQHPFFKVSRQNQDPECKDSRKPSVTEPPSITDFPSNLSSLHSNEAPSILSSITPNDVCFTVSALSLDEAPCTVISLSLDEAPSIVSALSLDEAPSIVSALSLDEAPSILNPPPSDFALTMAAALTEPDVKEENIVFNNSTQSVIECPSSSEAPSSTESLSVRESASDTSIVGVSGVTLHLEDEASGGTEQFPSAMSQAAAKTSAGRLKTFRKRLQRFFQNFKKTFFCCMSSCSDD